MKHSIFRNFYQISFVKYHSSTKGFSLVEVLMYIGIFSMLIVILFQMLVSILDVQLSSSGHSSIDQDGLYILSRLTYDIQRAQGIATPSAGQTSQNLEININGDVFSYSVASSSLVLADIGAGSVDSLNSVSTEVSNIVFTRRSDTQGQGLDTVTAAFTLTSKTITRGTQDSKDFRTTIGLRRP